MAKIAITAMAMVTTSTLTTIARAAVASTPIDVGVNMPMMAFGTFPGSLTCTVQEAVDQYLALGGRHIDTADDYGSQADVGRALRNSSLRREELFITTKIPGPIGKQAAMDLINGTALGELGLDYIDLVLIHYPCEPGHPDDCGDGHAQDRRDTWAGLMDLQHAGLIRAAGVSNWNTEHVKDIVDLDIGKVAVNQVEWHLGFHNETFLAEMVDFKVHVMAWASLSGPTTVFGHPGISLGDPRLKAVAGRYNASTAEVALRWSTQKGVTPVTASCTGSHVAGDLASFDLQISTEDMAVLDALEANASYAPGVVV